MKKTISLIFLCCVSFMCVFTPYEGSADTPPKLLLLSQPGCSSRKAVMKTLEEGAPSVFAGDDAAGGAASRQASRQSEAPVKSEGAGIILTADRSTVTTGDTLRFSLSLPRAATGTAELEMTNGYGNPTGYSMTKIDDTHYEFIYKISGRMSGKWKARASFFEGVGEDITDWLISDKVSFMVIPQMDTLWGMKVVPLDHTTIRTGEEYQIEVLGAFDDGYDRMIGEAALGTVYSVTKGTGVVSVSPEDVVKGLKTGEAVVTVRNGKLSATLDVTVRPSLK